MLTFYLFTFFMIFSKSDGSNFFNTRLVTYRGPQLTATIKITYPKNFGVISETNNYFGKANMTPTYTKADATFDIIITMWIEFNCNEYHTIPQIKSRHTE